MKAKKHQKASLQKDVRLGIVLLAILALLFGLLLVKIDSTLSLTITSFFAFVVFVSPYVLAGNPMLLKILREDFHAKPSRVWFFAAILWSAVQLYAILSGQFLFIHALKTGIWLGIATVLVRFLRQFKVPSALDYILVLLLWLPIEIGTLQGVSIPPVQGVLDPMTIVALLVLIYAYLVVRQFDVGFSYRLSGEDVRVVILDFIVFFFIAIIVGMLTGFLSITDRMPSLGDLISRFAAIFFFIALPEELLFRGVIFKVLEQQFKGQKRAVAKAMVVSSVIFGLAHINNPVAPFIKLNLGSTLFNIPWVYILLATVAGFFYCFVFIRTKKITAAAAIHLLVDWVWYAFFD
ncbi:CPBP family intramembrane metalloprotease [candidate division KSB1 bacterium]|nr:CPBP family intramembrane metalloprotease [candidate division KSB1 bacterium]